MSAKIKYVVWSGEGERGHKKMVTATTIGINGKRLPQVTVNGYHK